jgi:hypothetical protein
VTAPQTLCRITERPVAGKAKRAENVALLSLKAAFANS